MSKVCLLLVLLLTVFSNSQLPVSSANCSGCDSLTSPTNCGTSTCVLECTGCSGALTCDTCAPLPNPTNCGQSGCNAGCAACRTEVCTGCSPIGAPSNCGSSTCTAGCSGCSTEVCSGCSPLTTPTNCGSSTCTAGCSACNNIDCSGCSPLPNPTNCGVSATCDTRCSICQAPTPPTTLMPTKTPTVSPTKSCGTCAAAQCSTDTFCSTCPICQTSSCGPSCTSALCSLSECKSCTVCQPTCKEYCTQALCGTPECSACPSCTTTSNTQCSTCSPSGAPDNCGTSTCIMECAGCPCSGCNDDPDNCGGATCKSSCPICGLTSYGPFKDFVQPFFLSDGVARGNIKASSTDSFIIVGSTKSTGPSIEVIINKHIMKSWFQSPYIKEPGNLVASSVSINYNGAAAASFVEPSVSLSGDKGRAFVGTINDIHLFQMGYAGTIPSLTWVGGSTTWWSTNRPNFGSLLQSNFVLSGFLDLDIDFNIDEVFVGGKSGKLALIKAGWYYQSTATFPDRVLTDLTSFVCGTYNSFTDLPGYSAPAAFVTKDRVPVIAIGYSDGTLRVYELTLTTTTVTWKNKFDTTTNSQGRRILQATSGGTFFTLLPSNGYITPTFVDLDYDGYPDAAVIGTGEGSFAVGFISFSSSSSGSGTGCVGQTIDCSLGTFQSGCSCEPCPAGTYRNVQTNRYCTACGYPGVYCPIGSINPLSRSDGYCTYSAVASVNKVLSSGETTDYYRTFRDTLVQIFTSSGQLSYISSVLDARTVASERYGGLTAYRDSQGICGDIELLQSSVFVSAVKPSIAYAPISLANNYSVAVNFTIGAPDYVFVSTQESTGAFFTKGSIAPNSVLNLLLQIDSGSIDSQDKEIDFNITFTPFSYWMQFATGNSFGEPTRLPVHLSLTEATFIILPTDIQLTMREGGSANRVLTVYNIKSNSQALGVEVTEGSEWLSFAQDALYLDGSVDAGCVCLNETDSCTPSDIPVSNYSTPFQIIIDTNGLKAKDYSGKVRVTSKTSGIAVDVPINLKVIGGPVDWTKTQWEFFGGQTEDTLTVETGVSLKIVPSDTASNPTLVLDPYEATDITFKIDWAVDNQTTFCDPDVPCYGTQFVPFNPISDAWDVKLNVFMNGTYNITVDPVQNIPSFPQIKFAITVKPVTCTTTDINSEVNELGNKCSCKSGYGAISDTGVFVKCSICTTGQYSDGTCKECPSGKYSSGEGMNRCDHCDIGYQPNTDKTGCVKCESSQFVNITTRLCQACPPKTIVDENNECVYCGALEEPKNNKCSKCPDNWYVPKNSENGLCVPCDSDKYPVKGSDGYYSCKCLPEYYTKEDGSCGDCPPGCCCLGRTWKDIVPLKKYYKVLVGNVTTCTECRDLIDENKENCPGVEQCDTRDEEETAKAINAFLTQSANADGCTKCGTGFTGPLCVKCALNYHRTSTNDCGECLPKTYVIIAMLFGALAAIGVTVYIIRRTLVLSKNEDSTEIIILRIATSSMQLSAMQQGFDLLWPTFLSEFFVVMDYISSAGQSVFSLDCLIDTGASTTDQSSTCDVTTDDGRVRTFFLTAVFIACLPLFSLFVSSTFWIIRWVQKGKLHGKSYVNYFLVSNVVIFFLLHPTLSRTALKFFTCSKEKFNITADETVNFLEADFNIVCWSNEHKTWAFTLGILMLGLYAIGIPAGFAYILYINHHHVKKHYKKVFNFIYQGYRDQYYFWEIMIMIRKFAFAFIAVVLKPTGTDVQAYSALLVLLFAMIIQLQIRPYILPEMNFAEFFGLFNNFITTFLGLYMSSPNISPVTRLAFAGLIFADNIAFLCYITYYLCLAYTKPLLNRARRALGRESKESKLGTERAGQVIDAQIDVGSGATLGLPAAHAEESHEFAMNDVLAEKKEKELEKARRIA